MEVQHITWEELLNTFGDEYFRVDLYIQGSDPTDFPVLMSDGRIERSISASSTIARMPSTISDYVFAADQIAHRAKTWLSSNRTAVLSGDKG